MPETRYVVQMSKQGGDPYQILDKTARAMVSAEVTAREAAIAAEAAARAAADTAEAAAREAADTAEATARAAAIAQEAEDRAAAIAAEAEARNAAIAAEAAARGAAVAAVQEDATGVRSLLQNTDTKNVFEINRLMAKRIYNIPGDELTVGETIDGWKLDVNGRAVEDANYAIDRYRIPANGYALKLVISKDDENGGVYQFQKNSQAYTDYRQDTNRMGATHCAAINDTVIVPKDAGWLIVSRLRSTNSNVVQVMLEDINTIRAQTPPNDDWFTPELLAEEGYVDKDTGDFIEEEGCGWRRTDYIDCRDMQGTYFDYQNFVEWDNFAYYDENKTFIMNGVGWRNFVPYNACYFVASAVQSQMLEFKIKKPTYYDRIKLNRIDQGISDNLLLYGNYLDPDTIMDNRYFSSTTGYATADGNQEHFVTDYIKIPYVYPNIKDRYILGCSLREGEYGAFARQIVFYDESGFTVQINNRGRDYTDGQAILVVPDGAVYARVCFRKDESRFAVTFQNNSNIPTYEPYQKRIHGRMLPGLYNSVANSDAAVSAMIRTGLDYLRNSEIRYGWDHTLYDPECGGKYPQRGGQSWYEGDAYQIDCSSFVKACMEGIRFVCSRYLPANTENVTAPNAFQWDACADYDNVYAGGVAVDAKYERIYANKMAEYAYKKGYLFRVRDDFANIMPGDILFNQNMSQWQGLRYFDNIGHCVIVIDKYRIKSGGYEIKVMEAVSGTSEPYGVVTSIRQPYQFGSEAHPEWGDTWAARYPLPDCHYDFRCISEDVTPQTISYTATNASRNMLIQELTLSEDLTVPGLYTLVFQADVDSDNVFFEYWIGTGSNADYNVGSSGNRVKYRPDGLHVIHIVLGNNITIDDPAKLSIYLKSKDSTTRTGTVNFKNAKLYRGFVSGTPVEFD